MYDDARRFLAINYVLNGHSLLDAFDGDVDKASTVLGTTRVESLVAQLEELNGMHTVYGPLVDTFVNFFRTYQYAFVTPSNSEPVLLATLAESDRRGEVSPELRKAVVLQSIRDVCPIKKREAYIMDGVLYVPEEIKQGVWARAMLTAYDLYCFGPTRKPGDPVLKKRDIFTLAGFKSMSAAQAINVLSSFVKAGIAPVDYRNTTLLIPDLKPMYDLCGCIVSKSEAHSDSVDWVLDNTEKEKSIAVTLDYDTVRTLIVNSVSDLQNVVYGGTKVGVTVKAEG